MKPLLPFAITGILLFSSSAYAKIVCWQNSEGITECGQAVPPEYAQKETRILNKQGMTTDVQERAKTREELAAEKAAQEEEARKFAEEQRRLQKQHNYDRVLLSTFLNEAELERSRKRQHSTIDGHIEVTNITLKKLKGKRALQMKKAAGYERRGKAVPEKVKIEIESLQRQMDEKQAFIDRKKQEKIALDEKYDADLARFRELKGDKPGRR